MTAEAFEGWRRPQTGSLAGLLNVIGVWKPRLVGRGLPALSTPTDPLQREALALQDLIANALRNRDPYVAREAEARLSQVLHDIGVHEVRHT